jgi:predicted O-methyltransferase YrrM
LYAPFRIAVKYLRYYLTSSNGKGHGIHSPFVFEFITKVLNDVSIYPAYTIIEARRQQLLQNGRVIEVDDFGAGSVTGTTKKRSIASIARNAAKPPKFARLLFRITQYYTPGHILELGTSLGISAAYMAKGHPAAALITCEGAASIAAVAKQNFADLGLDNILVSCGNFDTTLPLLLQDNNAIDLVFIDGNHRKLPTVRYFEQLLPVLRYPGIIIFDDIHWSREMEEAWEAIKNHPAVMLTVDLFFIGIVFFNTDFKVKQHFVIRF